MFCVVSPAKKMQFEKIRDVIGFTDIPFPAKTDAVIKTLRGLSSDNIKELMDLSDKLAELNSARYRDFDKAPVNHAIFAFDGDTYVGLDAKTMNDKELEYAQGHLGMLSGLYGLLRPFDGIKPYRLEMGCGLPVAGKKDLYEFWGDDITDAINGRVKATGAKCVVNLASGEYIRSVNVKKLSVPMITMDFKEVGKDGTAKTVGLFAKRARGMAARFIIKNRLTKPEELKEFDWKDYEFDASVSTKDCFVFKR